MIKFMDKIISYTITAVSNIGHETLVCPNCNREFKWLKKKYRTEQICCSVGCLLEFDNKHKME